MRAYDSLTAPEAQVEDFYLDKLTSNTTLKLHIDNTRLTGLYQADDVYRYADQVMDYRPKRARLLSGRWATTFATLFGKENDDGSKRLSTPCLTFPNSLADAVAAAGTAYGAGQGAFWGGTLGSVFPGIGTAAGAGVGAALGAAIAGSFVAVLSNVDILMSVNSSLRHKRAVMSHEYGHYMFCNMLYDANEDAVDHLAWGTLVDGNDVTVPLRYTNEAFAEYFMGQVASGSNYRWMLSHEGPEDEDWYCSSRTTPCWDANVNGVSTSEEDQWMSVGRVATMFMDVFDGQGADRKASVPSDGDAWYRASDSDNLTYSAVSYGDTDAAMDRVALPGSEIRTIARYLADDLEPFVKYSIDDGFEPAGYALDDTKLRWAIDSTLVVNGESWCNRCITLALHEPERVVLAGVHDLWELCQTDPDLVGLLGVHPEDPDNLRINIDDCKPCKANEISNPDTGECEVCSFTVVGNSCMECQPDQTLSGGGMELKQYGFDTTVAAASDNCPDVFVLEIQDADALLSRLAAKTSTPSVFGWLEAGTAAGCEQQAALTTFYTNPSGDSIEPSSSGTGSWLCEPSFSCLEPCVGLPTTAEIEPSDLGSGSSLWFSAPALSGIELKVNAAEPGWVG